MAQNGLGLTYLLIEMLLLLLCFFSGGFWVTEPFCCGKNMVKILRKKRKQCGLGFLPQNGLGLKYLLTEPLVHVLCHFFTGFLGGRAIPWGKDIVKKKRMCMFCGLECGKNIEKEGNDCALGFLPQK